MPPVDSRIGVMVIDMQPHCVGKLEFSSLAPEQTASDELLYAQSRVLLRAAEYDLPVYVAELSGERYSPTIDDLTAIARGSGRLRTYPKISADPFSNPLLEESITGDGVQGLVMMGMLASMCVIQGARSAAAKGFRVMTASQLIADTLPSREETTIRREFSRFGEFYSDYLDLPIFS